MRKTGCVLAAICFVVASAPRVAIANPAAKALSAEAVLDRYVQVTGGTEVYRRYGSFAKYSTVTRADGTTFNTAVYHSRNGATQTEIDAGADSGERGIANGIVWEYSKKNGAKVLDGKAAARKLAEARGLDADDWRVRFPEVKSAGTQTINGKSCYHLKLTQTDGSVVDRFYDVHSGLLVREVAAEFDENGAEQPVTTDIEEYDTTLLGLKHPALLRVKEGDKAFTIHIDSQTFFPGTGIAGADVPRDVIRAVAECRGGSALPNAVDIVERFVQATGGREAYRTIRTEAIKADIAFPAQNLKFPMVMYATTGKTYTSLDIPSLGKFEFGSDGTTAWQKSVVLGPQLQPRSLMGGLLGPNANDVLRWTESDLTLQTLAKEDVNGSPCYKLKLGSDATGQFVDMAWFDVQTGLLIKSTATATDGTRVVSEETIYGDYQLDGSVKTAHHVETKIAGQNAIIDVKELSINAPLPEGVFDLPPDVRALKDKKLAEMKK